MLISAAEFDQRLAQGSLRIALIGMSNIGKSYTAARIVKAAGFTCYDVDKEIQNRLDNPSMDEMAKWMGHPYEDGYSEKAAEYLALESELSMAAGKQAGNVVLDTTGSVIYIADVAKRTLKEQFLIIYIRASADDIETLIDRYFAYPKPTIWGDVYAQIEGKTQSESLLACYPELLDIRTKQYADFADIVIDAKKLANPDMPGCDILPFIRSHLD